MSADHSSPQNGDKVSGAVSEQQREAVADIIGANAELVADQIHQLRDARDFEEVETELKDAAGRLLALAELASITSERE